MGAVLELDKDGDIISVLPLRVPVKIPDQTEIIAMIDKGLSLQEILLSSRFKELKGVQGYGLMTKWAAGILSRKDDRALRLELSDEHLTLIEDLYGIRLNDYVDDEMKKGGAKEHPFDNLAKFMIRFNPKK